MKRKISKKDQKAINEILNNTICLNHVEEFEELERSKLFDERPELWSDTENAIYEYTERIRNTIRKEIFSQLCLEDDI